MKECLSHPLSCYSKHQLHCLESFSLAGTLSLTKHSSALQVHSHQLKRRGSSQVLPMHPPSLSEDCQVQQTVPKRVVVLGSAPTGTKMRHSVTTWPLHKAKSLCIPLDYTWSHPHNVRYTCAASGLIGWQSSSLGETGQWCMLWVEA